MAKFNCQGCGRTMSVPDQYAGKRVRCPGCQTPQRVPTHQPPQQDDIELVTQPMADLSGLDASDESGVRRLRQILIGCGSCQKTIKVPESKLGRTMPCTSCGTVLKVDAFNLSKAKGDLIDMTHLELEQADMLLDGGSHGSTLGGSSIHLDGTGGGSALGGGYELGRAPSGSMSGVSVTDSQSQMRELRELNELKHSGQITSDEYRERKKEIYAGKTLAIQAMSRSADGSGNRPVIKRDDKPAFLPTPVLVLVVAVALAGGGFAAWSMMQGPESPPPRVVATPPAVEPAPESQPAEVATNPQDPAPSEPVDTAVPVAPPVDAANVGTGSDGPEMGGASVETRTAGDTPDAPVTMFEIASDIGVIGSASSASDVPAVRMQINEWSTPWPRYTVGTDDKRAIGKACQWLQRMAVRDASALIGVAVGPAADSLDSPAYRGFRQAMQDTLTDTAESEGVLDDLNFRTSERTAQLGTLESHRFHVTSKSNRNVRATILTGIQDGYCVSYWFAGSKTLYTDFLDTVGKATFAAAH